MSLDAHLEQHSDRALADSAPGPDGQLKRKETASKVWHALDELPFDQRTAVVLREIDGLSYEEIAAKLCVSLGKVKTDIFRGREALRKKLGSQLAAETRAAWSL